MKISMSDENCSKVSSFFEFITKSVSESGMMREVY